MNPAQKASARISPNSTKLLIFEPLYIQCSGGSKTEEAFSNWLPACLMIIKYEDDTRWTQKPWVAGAVLIQTALDQALINENR